jgi:glycosyltransferase involved in cell wall biosynthesis
MKKAIIIPIFLRLNRPEELPALEQLRLAKRAIGSLNSLKDQDFILILPVCFDLVDSAGEVTYLEMDRFLRQTVKELRQERTLVFSSRHLKYLREYLDQKSFRNYFSVIDLKGFSKIRNIGLLLAQALSVDVAVFIDDDEVVEDPDYLEVACEHLIRRWNGKEVVGKGGFYVNPDGTILLPPLKLWWRFLWDKTKWMNRVWEKILLSKERLVHSPMLLGGNLVLHYYLFRSIPFDPYVSRGEDTDYLINASQWGFCLLFDKQLQIKHLHPKRTRAYFHEELRLDIERFLYERQKMKSGLGIDLNPYPGYFLKWTLYPKAALTSLLLSLDYLGKGEWKKAVSCIDNIHLVLKKKEGGWLRYLRFRADWERVMADIRKEGLSHVLKACWV